MATEARGLPRDITWLVRPSEVTDTELYFMAACCATRLGSFLTAAEAETWLVPWEPGHPLLLALQVNVRGECWQGVPVVVTHFVSGHSEQHFMALAAPMSGVISIDHVTMAADVAGLVASMERRTGLHAYRTYTALLRPRGFEISRAVRGRVRFQELSASSEPSSPESPPVD